MKNAILAYYPETLNDDIEYQAETVVAILKEIRDLNWIVILPQYDYKSIKFWDILKQLSEPVHFERSKFIACLKQSEFIIGNSSSLIFEAPYIGIPSILIGDRQKGRLMADSIIQAEPIKESIQAAFAKLYSKEFQDLMKTDYYMPYKGENVAEKMLAIIRERLPNIKMKKGFYDLPRF